MLGQSLQEESKQKHISELNFIRVVRHPAIDVRTSEDEVETLTIKVNYMPSQPPFDSCWTRQCVRGTRIL